MENWLLGPPTGAGQGKYCCSEQEPGLQKRSLRLLELQGCVLGTCELGGKGVGCVWVGDCVGVGVFCVGVWVLGCVFCMCGWVCVCVLWGCGWVGGCMWVCFVCVGVGVGVWVGCVGVFCV